jgi:tetratricopeptide (TPR) repeat protein
MPAEQQQRLKPSYEQAQAEPDSIERVGALAMLLHAHQLYDEAAQCYERARFLAPDQFRWTYYLGAVEQERGQGPRAQALLEAASRQRATYAPAHVRLGNLMVADGKLDPAAEEFQKAAEIDPKLASAYHGWGRVLTARGEVEAAAEKYQHATELEEEFGEAHYALGLAYRRLGREADSEKHLTRYEQLQAMPTPRLDPLLEEVDALVNQQLQTQTASLALPKESLEATAQELETALEAQPWLISARANLIALYFQIGQPAKAEAHYRKAMEIDPSDARLNYNWGVMQGLQNNPDEAAKALRRALDSDPKYADAYAQLGELLWKQEKHEQALQQYRKAIEADPSHRRAHLLLGQGLIFFNRVDEGLDHLRQTVRIEDDQTPMYMRGLAIACAVSGNVDEAEKYFREARNRADNMKMNVLVQELDKDLMRLGQMRAAGPR